MKKIFITLFFICLNANFYSQNFENEIQKSISYLKNNEIDEFRKTYPKLYFSYLKDNLSQYENAINDTKKHNYESAIKNLDSLVSDDIFIDEILDDKNFLTLHPNKNWKNLIKKIKVKKLKYNNSLRKKLKAIQNEDQGIRVLYISMNQFTNDSILKNRVHDEMKFVDEKNSKSIQQIIDKYGWVGSDKVGNEGNRTIFLTIQHVDDLIVQQKYLPILEKAIKDKNADPWHLAFLTDRIRMNQGKKQIYGSQVIHYKEAKKSFVVPLENPEHVDELRKQVGLPPLNDYLEEQGLKWDLQEYLNDLPENERLYKEKYGKNNSR